MRFPKSEIGRPRALAEASIGRGMWLLPAYPQGRPAHQCIRILMLRGDLGCFRPSPLDTHAYTPIWGRTCPIRNALPRVIAECGFTGSTAAMADFVGRTRPPRVVLLNECSMSDNVALQYPDLEFVRPCNLGPHMKRITLPKIRRSLETMTHEVTVDPEIAERARRAVERMMALG